MHSRTQGLIWVQVRANIGSREWTAMVLEQRAVSARVIKHFVTIFNKTPNNIQLLTSISVDMRIYLPEKVIFHFDR